MQEFSASVNAIIAALTRHLLPDNEGIYLKIMADIEKETAKVPGL
jgi:antibiotic biosynthesis monooxygenase (ABM) superfamily enzyme